MPFRLWDRIKDWVLLFVLLAITVLVMLAQNEPLVRALRGFALDATAWVEVRFAWAGGFLRALDENEVLREESIELASEVARSREAVVENERLRRLLAFRDITELPLLPAEVIDKDIYGAENTLTINVGNKDSVKVDMAVIDERGIIGKVVLVSDRFSLVMPYLNTEFRSPGKIQPMGAEGIVTWDGEQQDRLKMEHVIKTEPVLRGHLVVTSGYSSVFPAGYPIGFVDSLATRPGRNQYELFITPAAPLSRVRYVFVIMTRPDPERLALRDENFRE